MREAERMGDILLPLYGQEFRAFKIDWGPFGRTTAKPDAAIVAAARKAIEPDAFLMVDAGASDTFWPQGYKWALNTAEMLADYNVTWFEPLHPDALDDYVALKRAAKVSIAGGACLRYPGANRRMPTAPALGVEINFDALAEYSRSNVSQLQELRSRSL